MLSFFRTALRTYRIQSWALSHLFCLPTTPSVDSFPVISPASHSPGFRRILGLRWSTRKAVFLGAHHSPSVICRAAKMNGGSTALEQLSEADEPCKRSQSVSYSMHLFFLVGPAQCQTSFERQVGLPGAGQLFALPSHCPCRTRPRVSRVSSVLSMSCISAVLTSSLSFSLLPQARTKE